MDRKELIRTLYLYLFSLIGLVVVVMGLVQLVDLGLKVLVFKKADQVLIYPERFPVPAVKTLPDQTTEELTLEEQEKIQKEQLEYQTKQREADRERNAANALAMILVGTPLFLYHWKIIQKDKKS